MGTNQRDPGEVDADSNDLNPGGPPSPEDEHLALGEDEVELVMHYLRRGRRLPPHLLPRLFEVPKEYQLSYAGKLRESDVLADTMSVPLQAQRVIGDPEEASQNLALLSHPWVGSWTADE